MSEQHFKIVNGERVLMTQEEVDSFVDLSNRQLEYIANRTGSPEATSFDNVYPGIQIQLDKLWHDIDNDLFGIQAKNGEFYTAIKAVKDANPKQ